MLKHIPVTVVPISDILPYKFNLYLIIYDCADNFIGNYCNVADVCGVVDFCSVADDYWLVAGDYCLVADDYCPVMDNYLV